MSAVEIKYAVLAGLSVIGSAIAQLLGGWDAALITLLIIMAVDYITGVLIAAVWKKSSKSESGTLDSKAGFKGICRKIVILLAVLIATQLEQIIDTGGAVRTLVIMFFIGNEGISVVENFGIMGVPLPTKLKLIFEQLKDKNDPAGK